jgi:hypothetical protein
MTAAARIKPRSGLLAEWQPVYAEHGIALFPIKAKEKKPAIRNWIKVGLEGSADLARKFAAFDSFAFVVGPRSGITVLDVDTPDERVLMDAMARHGESPFIVRTHSGKWHAWYRHAGERRRIRHWKDRPIDVLGGGYVVAPPSFGEKGRYEIIAGTLDDLANLPALRNLNLSPPLDRTRANDVGAAPQGSEEVARNDDLFHACLRRAYPWSNLDALLDFARKRNEQYMPPLPYAEVVQVASNAWS